jgi:DNA/RNA-binding domain of Phe-tRNA-synthetase-like protein
VTAAPGFTIAPAVFARLPGLRVVAVVAGGIRPARAAAVDERWVATWEGAHRGSGLPNAQAHPHVQAWRAAMRSIGAPHKEFPSSIESLLRRALKVSQPPRINPLVDFYNGVSLQHVVPAGGYDLDQATGIELRETRAGDTFQALDAGEPEAVPTDEVAYTSGSLVLTRHLLWRQSRQALISAATARALFVSEILPSHAAVADEVRSSLVQGLRELFAADVRAAILSAEEPALSLAVN